MALTFNHCALNLEDGPKLQK